MQLGSINELYEQKGMACENRARMRVRLREIPKPKEIDSEFENSNNLRGGQSHLRFQAQLNPEIGAHTIPVEVVHYLKPTDSRALAGMEATSKPMAQKWAYN